ncbi:prepilin peptidase [Gordonia sp. (in: high G+C Gram-positive bacteria)]|uniref:prepilin peptidase n=1 Tax=Gordonia sp. (in: high G+C Gram-positive bacteria) TaxID=84139 RepID=UPI00169EB7B5|nr:prepilin peptidase [Gordonia sp. (in: high G+C Gram-positive bacteria)]NLG47484.1 prepilin peptidase [Gordonia sp. (in: high G+C Gram-positive bacteria)]
MVAACLLVVAWLLVGAWLLVVADVDRRTGRIPNTLVLPAVVGTAAVAAALPAVGGGAVTLALPYAAAFTVHACGGGDVKFAVPCGGLLADPLTALGAVLVAALIAATTTVVTRRRRVPHGPALAVATGLMLCL